MKKIFLIFIFLIFAMPCAFCVSFGMYKPETEYGLFDGFKFNFKDREKDQKIIEIRSETKEEQARLEREKKKPKQEIDENEQFRFMRDGIVTF